MYEIRRKILDQGVPIFREHSIIPNMLAHEKRLRQNRDSFIAGQLVATVTSYVCADGEPQRLDHVHQAAQDLFGRLDGLFVPPEGERLDPAIAEDRRKAYTRFAYRFVANKMTEEIAGEQA